MTTLLSKHLCIIACFLITGATLVECFALYLGYDSVGLTAFVGGVMAFFGYLGKKIYDTKKNPG